MNNMARRREEIQMKYLAFDLEIAALIPEGETDWHAYRPLGITCAAFARSSDSDIETAVWYGMDGEGSPAPRMMQHECVSMVKWLMRSVKEGYTLLTWNGCAFDFCVLAEESGLHQECADLAMNHCDMMVQVHCLKGYPVGLNAIAKGLGLQGKTEGMSGALAPQMWAEGRYDEVLAYVAQDARSTLEVSLAVEERGGLSWIAKSGRTNHLAIPRWLTVFEAMQLPEPDTSWMSNPIPRSHFVEWMLPEAAD